jgi:aspartate kinase
MARIVLKFGGTSVGDIDRIRNVARKVKAEVDRGNEVAVVTSAMSGATNQLVKWVNEIAPLHDAREYDVVVATGEQVTIGLLAMALQQQGVKARSWMSWQIPIRTDAAHTKARIVDIETADMARAMAAGEVPIVPGFQGLSPDGHVTTLGRGGSDTSAVALAAALKADRCDIYTDVDGVYTTDPRIVEKARKIDQVTYEEMLEMASQGSKVLQTRSVELAMNHHVRVQVLSSFDAALGSDLPGTMVVDEEEIMAQGLEKSVVSGIAFSKDEAKITVTRVADRPGVAAAIFGPLAEANINVDMIVQNVSADGKTTDLTFTVPATDFQRALEVITRAKQAIGYRRLDSATDVAKISVIGIGMRSHAGVAAQAFRALGERAVNIRAITTSEIKFSLLIDAAFTELAVRTLHSLYGLDKASP